ncbi:MAG TPA: sigma-70 family RNA polymerase sigma factor [Planctomycetota bacterium]|nr:sigma-70 family RNA polymerase sigma factor [Planctomycetota bacterium]
MDPEPAQPTDDIDLEVLYREQAASLYAWACLRTERRLRQWVTPEDLTQEIWVRATRAAKARDASSGPPRAWLFTIAKHVLYEVRRLAERNGSEGAAGGSTTRLLALDQVPAEITSLTQRLSRDDAVKDFLTRVDQLDDEDRMLLIHVGLEAMPQTEAAARLGMGYDALAKRWQRLRERVRAWPSTGNLLP